VEEEDERKIKLPNRLDISNRSPILVFFLCSFFFSFIRLCFFAWQSLLNVKEIITKGNGMAWKVSRPFSCCSTMLFNELMLLPLGEVASGACEKSFDREKIFGVGIERLQLIRLSFLSVI
jgi:hypothetical protein